MLKSWGPGFTLQVFPRSRCFQWFSFSGISQHGNGVVVWEYIEKTMDFRSDVSERAKLCRKSAWLARGARRAEGHPLGHLFGFACVSCIDSYGCYRVWTTWMLAKGKRFGSSGLCSFQGWRVRPGFRLTRSNEKSIRFCRIQYCRRQRARNGPWIYPVSVYGERVGGWIEDAADHRGRNWISRAKTVQRYKAKSSTGKWHDRGANQNTEK